MERGAKRMAATGMLITALHLAGLATLTPNPMRFLNQLLDRPDTDRPFLILVAGYPSAKAQVPKLDKHSLEHYTTFIDP
jgi:iodotyrosine deiodinase